MKTKRKTPARRVEERTAALARTHRALRMLTECGHALLRESNEEKLLREACRIAVAVGGYRMAWIGYAEHDARRSVRPTALVGAAKGYLSRVTVRWADVPLGRGPMGTAIRTGKPSLCRDVSNDPSFRPWRREALKRGCASVLALPLMAEHGCLGALTIYAAQTDAFDDSEVRLLQQLAGDLSFGIMALRNRLKRRELERQALDVTEREQRRLGQDLHDGVLQSIVAVGYRISAVRDSLSLRAAPEAADLEKARQLVEKTVRQAHELARGLYPAEMRRGGMADALRELARHTQDTFGIPCRFTSPVGIGRTDVTAAAQLYRIAQEAVNNAAKHSKAQRIAIRLSRGRGRLALTVRDTGIGFDPNKNGNGGLEQRIMNYRADMIGAEFKIESACGKGTTVTCVIPPPSRAMRRTGVMGKPSWPD